jgi:TRAP-type C4-dicarboxylate transport system substrate-binding protein
LVPENTDWGSALNRMAKEWHDASNGQVELIVYHNGVVGGDEADIKRKLDLNQIQAAIFTSMGLGLISPEVMTLSAPFLIRNDTELDMVLAQIKSDLETGINKKGYFTLCWAKSGWVKVFSKTPVFVPADLKRLKLGTSEDTPQLNQAFKEMGYQLVPVDFNSVLVSLNSGMIDAIYQSAISAGAFQLFGLAKNMTLLNIAPFMGGIVMNQKAWRSIPDEYKPKLLAIAKQIETEIGGAVVKLESDAIKAMTGYGLIVNKLSSEQEQLWYSDIEKSMPSLLDRGVFDRVLYEKINKSLQSYRSR